MKRSAAVLKAYVDDELARLGRALDEFATALSGIDMTSVDPPSFQKAAIGSYLHAFYTGCEHVFRAIAEFFENELDSTRWHSDLIGRMRLEIPGVRPRVLSDPVAAQLDLYRGFRNVFRESYGYELDWKRLRPLTEGYLEVAQTVFREVRAFLSAVPDEIAEDA